MNRVLAVLAGVITGGVTVAVVESIGHLIWPLPEGTDVTNPEALASIMETIPFQALLAVLVAWILGAFMGGLVARNVDKSPGPSSSILTGLVLTIFGVLTMLAIPHPIWMWVFGIITPLPAALLGAKMVPPRPIE